MQNLATYQGGTTVKCTQFGAAFGMGFAVTVALVCGMSTLARADDSDIVDAANANAPQRVFGIGTSFGGGVAGADALTGSTGATIVPALLLPTLELQLFLPGEYSIDLVAPVLNMAVTSAVLGGTFINMDLMFNANVGKGKMRFVVGPGVGFSHAQVDSSTATSFRIPAQLGFEALSKRRGFGFKFMARPWVEFATGSATDAVGGGLLGVVAFSGYFTDKSD
ncbi:MAG: hypothetical protein IPK82_02270 [Polyangiaceae bacterium]|nr:hypothetical protein [Polyangiaceae bacterium]